MRNLPLLYIIKPYKLGMNPRFNLKPLIAYTNMLHFASIKQNMLKCTTNTVSGVNCNTLVNLVKRIIAQIFFPISIYLWVCLLWEIFANTLTLNKFQPDNNSNRSPEIC